MTYLALSLGWILASIAAVWAWRRLTKPRVTCDEPSFERWLRAGSPPMPWFLGLAELEQERLAQLGDMHQQDVCLGVGYAVRDPDLAKAGRDPSDVSGEVVMLEALMRQALTKGPTAQDLPAPAPAPSVTMAGVTERRNGAQRRRVEAKNASRRLFGRSPDRSEA